jgi:hypothetical protein
MKTITRKAFVVRFVVHTPFFERKR